MLRGIILSTELVFMLPRFLNVTGIWLVIPVTEFITVSIVIILVNKENNVKSRGIITGI